MRALGESGIEISPVALGCWPIAGVTSLDTNEADSLATIRACFDLGINHLDTAYVYGPEGESEKLIAKAIAGRRDEVVIATKCGIHYEQGEMVNCGRPETLHRECDLSLRRLDTDRVELMYLHSVDPNVPIEDSAGALKEMLNAGKTQAVGVSNAPVENLERFQTVCPIAAVQVPFNMLQQDVMQRIVPWCHERNIAVTVYWALMKGLLAGKLRRDHVLAEGDSRKKYPMYQGEEWEKNQDFIDRLEALATACDCTIAQLVIAWTIRQPGITAALCGAKRPEQIAETAAAMEVALSEQQMAELDAVIVKRGTALGGRGIS